MDTREQIITATERLIHSQGLARVTTKQIARAANCAEGTLFRYFPTKNDLLLAVIQEHLPNVANTVRPDLAGTGTVQAHLEAIARATLTYYEQLTPLTVALFGDTTLLDQHRVWMQMQQAGPQRIYERVAEYLAAEQQLGRINQGLEPLHIASLLLGACFQFAFMRYFTSVNPLPLSEAEFVVGTIRTLLAGAAPPVDT